MGTSRDELKRKLLREAWREFASKGGEARKKALTKKERQAIAKKGATARWAGKRKAGRPRTK